MSYRNADIHATSSLHMEGTFHRSALVLFCVKCHENSPNQSTENPGNHDHEIAMCIVIKKATA